MIKKLIYIFIIGLPLIFAYNFYLTIEKQKEPISAGEITHISASPKFDINNSIRYKKSYNELKEELKYARLTMRNLEKGD